MEDVPHEAPHGVVIASAVAAFVNRREQSPYPEYRVQITMFAGVGKPTIAKLIKVAFVAPALHRSSVVLTHAPDANEQLPEFTEVNDPDAVLETGVGYTTRTLALAEVSKRAEHTRSAACADGEIAPPQN